MDKKLSSIDFEILSLYRSDYTKKLLLTEIAKEVGVNHRTVRLHLNNLEKYNIITLENKKKLVYVYPSLNESFLRAMVMTEIYIFLKDKRPVIKHLARKCMKNKFCIVFGSYASYSETDMSDLDLVVDKEIDTRDLFVEVQQFEYKSLKKIPNVLFKEIQKTHIILKGYEEFVYEMVRKNGSK